MQQSGSFSRGRAVDDLDIVAFLRARYDEREKPLREVVRQLDAYADGDEDGIDGGWSLWGSFGRAIDTAFKPRELLDDIAAKRQIVKGVEATLNLDRAMNPRFNVADRMTYSVLLRAEYQTARLLALPYAGHPEFREEWTA